MSDIQVPKDKPAQIALNNQIVTRIHEIDMMLAGASRWPRRPKGYREGRVQELSEERILLFGHHKYLLDLIEGKQLLLPHLPNARTDSTGRPEKGADSPKHSGSDSDSAPGNARS